MPRDAPRRFRLLHAQRTDTGMVRLANQDAVACVAGGPDLGELFMVADGMGGHAAGELASRLATECIPQAYRKLTEVPPPAALRRSIRKANSTIHARAQGDPDLRGMGTTCSCLVIVSGVALVAHVGDSRVYRLRGGALEQLTFDHSLVWEVAAASHTTADKVPACIPKNMITRSLGPQPKVSVDIEGPHPLAGDDVFLLCSDGLNAVVEDRVIGAILGALPPESAAQALIDLANLRGGPDNVSVVVVRVEAERDAAEPACGVTDPAAGSRRGRSLVGGVPPATWLSLAGTLAAVAWFASRAEYPWAVAASAGFGASVVAAMVQRARAEKPGSARPPLGGPYGDGPYREVRCPPGEPAAEALRKVVAELAELEATPTPHSGLLIEDWRLFHQHRRQADQALAGGEPDGAARAYAAAVGAAMEQARAAATTGR